MLSRYRECLVVFAVFFSLMGLVVIQFVWLVRAAENQEELFTRSVNLALSKTVQDLAERQTVCRKMQTNLNVDKRGLFRLEILNREEVLLVDSLLKANLLFFDVRLCYTFEVEVEDASVGSVGRGCDVFGDYPASCWFGGGSEVVVNRPSVLLKIYFPGNTEFLLAQMGVMFVSSLFLIVVLSFIFFVILRSLKREKVLAANTRDFINNMTHEFKTPLASVLLAVKMVRREAVDASLKRLVRFSDIILEEVGKLKRQIDVLLEIATFERRAFVVERTACSVHDALGDAIRTIEIQVVERSGSLDFRRVALRDIVLADCTLLTNAFLNLLDNANKYSVDAPSIVVETANIGDTIVVSFRDNGIGIGKDNQRYIFEKFYRVSTGNVHDVKGFGLGLNFVKRVVEAHGGDVSFESEENKGSVFRVTLPLNSSEY